MCNFLYVLAYSILSICSVYHKYFLSQSALTVMLLYKLHHTAKKTIWFTFAGMKGVKRERKYLPSMTYTRSSWTLQIKIHVISYMVWYCQWSHFRAVWGNPQPLEYHYKEEPLHVCWIPIWLRMHFSIKSPHVNSCVNVEPWEHDSFLEW